MTEELKPVDPEHGGTADGDCTILFITNKPFDIHYPGRE